MKKNMVLLSLLLVGSYELMATNIAPLALAKAKGYAQIVAFFYQQGARANGMGVKKNPATAGELVHILNSSKSEKEALAIIQTMYWPRVGASCEFAVPSNSQGWGKTGNRTI